MSALSEMTYSPKPLSTGDVQLSEPLVELTERLAEHIHNVWAKRRISEGWTFGPKRDDDAKKHPGLVPYTDLSESEKEYDRQTALEAVRAIVALGYRVLPPDAPKAVDDEDDDG